MKAVNFFLKIGGRRSYVDLHRKEIRRDSICHRTFQVKFRCSTFFLACPCPSLGLGKSLLLFSLPYFLSQKFSLFRCCWRWPSFVSCLTKTLPSQLCCADHLLVLQPWLSFLNCSTCCPLLSWLHIWLYTPYHMVLFVSQRHKGSCFDHLVLLHNGSYGFISCGCCEWQHLLSCFVQFIQLYKDL